MVLVILIRCAVYRNNIICIISSLSCELDNYVLPQTCTISVSLQNSQLFGLPGLLCTISQNSPEQRPPVEIYGPLGLRQFLRTTLNLSRSILGFQVAIHELCHDRKPEDIDGIVREKKKNV